jgi:hypothetical protein
MRVSGHVKLYRAIVNNPIYEKPPLYLRVFERLILEANWKCQRIPFGKSDLLIKRGEKVTSVRQIAEWVAWYDRGVLRTPNPKTIHEILDWLTLSHMIEMVNRSNAQVTHYNVVNYCEYQASTMPEVTVAGQQSKQQLDTNNNINKGKKGKEDKIFYGEFGNVGLTTDEFDKLAERLGKDVRDQYIERLSGYLEQEGAKYKSHYATILNWWRRDKEKQQTTVKPSATDGLRRMGQHED